MFVRVTRLLAILAVLLSAAVALPRVAQAHATLVKCAGLAKNATLSAAPKLLTCTFAEGVNPKGSFIRVFAAIGDGGEVDLGNAQVSFSNVHQMTVGLPRLNKGQYVLLWFTISADDGHKAGGAFTFTIT